MKNPLSSNGEALIFTRQNKKSLEIIQRDGRFINKKQYIQNSFQDIAPHFLKCYDYFVSKAKERVAKPTDVEYPIWCSVDPRSVMVPGEKDVLYSLVVPEKEIIYFDGFKWDYVLNLHYVPKDQKDLEEYEKEIESKGFANSYEFISGRYAMKYPFENKRITDSWTRIFDIDCWNIFSVQANIWEIKKEWIVDIRHFEE